MKVICITNNAKRLKRGEVYLVREMNGIYCLVNTNIGDESGHWYHMESNFKTVEEIRDNKLKEIGI